MPERTRIFIAYCFPEKRWLDRVQAAVASFAASETLIVWDERRIRAGAIWQTELPEVLASSKVAMMIVSDLFLQSDFITRVRLPARLERERENGLQICWVLASHCLFELAGLKESDAANTIDSALDGLSGPKRDAELAEIGRKVALLFGVAPAPPPSPETAANSPAPPGTRSAERGTRKTPTQTAANPPTPPDPASASTAAAPASSQPTDAQRSPRKRKQRSATPPRQTKEPSTETVDLPLSPPLPEEAKAETLPAGTTERPSAEPSNEPPTSEPPAAVASIAVAPPPEPIPAPARPQGPLAPLLRALDAAIKARHETVLKLSRFVRWLLVAALVTALLSLVAALFAGITHFVILAGFAAFLASQALFVRARLNLLGQGLIGLRYARNGIADETLPSRQRIPLLKKAEETLWKS
jgi:hypothetical protein